MARVVQRSYLDKNYDETRYWKAIPLSVPTRNCELEMRYTKKKQELRTQGRTEDEISDRTLFGCCDKYDDVEEVSVGGLRCGMKFLNSCLGNASKGVSLGKHADVFLRKRYDDGLQSCWVVIFKVMYGRVKGVLPIQTPPYREPALDADCHCSFISSSVDDPLHLQEIKSQVYMFERDPVLPTSFSKQPRQCVPVAVVMYNRVGSLTDAVDLRLVADNQRHGSGTCPGVSSDDGSQSDVSVVVGLAGRRRVVVSRSDKALDSGVNVATTSKQQQTSRRTVSFCPSGTITKITITNDREMSDNADHGNLSASRVSSSAAAAASSLSPPGDVRTALLLPAASANDNTRSQYSHLIRRRKTTQAETVSPRDWTESVGRDAADPPSPRADDTPLTLLRRQKTLVSDITKQLSVELSAVTAFLRVTRPAHIDDRERIAVQSMQRISAAFKRLTPACLTYRQYCTGTCVDANETALPDVDALRVQNATLRCCRDKLMASFSERRDVIFQTPIAGEQRLFTFVWLQRHSAAIADCINVVIEVLETVPTCNSQTSSCGQTATPNAVRHHEMNADEVKPDISRLNNEIVQIAGIRLGHDQLDDEVLPPPLTPAMKTDIVASVDEPPVLQPCTDRRLDGTSNNARSFRRPSVTTTTQDDLRCSNLSGTSTLAGRPVVSVTRLPALKQEQEEDVFTVQSVCGTSVETVSTETQDRSQHTDHFAPNVVITDTSGEKNDVVQEEHVDEQIQRLLDARDQEAFSRLLIDSVCSMPTDDFHRVREKLIKKFIDDQRRAAASSDVWPGQVTAKIEAEELDGGTQAEGNVVSDDVNSSALSSLKIVNVRSCSGEETDGSWLCDVESRTTVGNQLVAVKQEQLDSSTRHGGSFTDAVSVDDEDVTTTNYITIAPIEMTTDVENNDDGTTTECIHDDQTQRQYSDITDTQPPSIATRHHQLGYMEVQTQRSQADKDDDGRNESRDWQGAPTQCTMSADAEMTSPQTMEPRATSSRRRKAHHRRSSRRPPLLPTPTSVARECPWLFISRLPPHDQPRASSAAVCGPFRYPPPLIRHYSYPKMSLPSPLRQRRPTDVCFQSSDRERCGDEPAWLSDTTTKQQRGSTSLHCCLAIVSRCLHAAAARNYADRERRRRMTNGWRDDEDGAPSRHSSLTQQPDDGKRRAVETQPTWTTFLNSRPVTVRDSASGQKNETSGRARNRSDSDSNSSHRPRVVDLRHQPIYPARVRNWAYPIPSTSRSTTVRDLRDRRRIPRDTLSHGRRSTTRGSVVERKHKKEKLRRHSVSSERSSPSSASLISSHSSNKDRRSTSKHSSADEHDDKTEGMKHSGKIFQTATDNRDADSLFNNTCTSTLPFAGGTEDSALRTDKVNEYDSDNTSVRRSSSSHSGPTLDAGKTSDIGNEISTDASSTQVRPSENCATSDSGLKSPLSDTVSRSKTPPADNREVDNVEQPDTPKRSDGSPHGIKHRHSRSGSRPRSRNNSLSVEAAKSENSDSYSHDHQTESTSENREKLMGHSSAKKSRSRSGDRGKSKSSKHGVEHKHRTKSRHDERERKRSRGRRRSRSSSRRRNASTASSDNDRCTSKKRNRKRELLNSGEDQLSDQRRLKTERKRLEKLHKKAERALQKIQQLELNYKETNLHNKKSRSREMSATTISQDQDVLNANSNKCDWKSTADKLGFYKSLNVADDFIAVYTSPVSSPSVLSEEEPKSCDNSESLLPTRLEHTWSEKQRDENERQVDLQNCAECDAGDSSGRATAVTPHQCIVATSSCVADDERNDEHERLFDSEFNLDSTTSMTTTATRDASHTGAAVDQADQLSGLQISVIITTDTKLCPNN